MEARAHKPLFSRPIREELVRLADEHPEAWARVCLQIARMEGWDVYPDLVECRRMVRRRLNGRRGKNAPRNFDADWLLIVVDAFPDSAIAALFMRRAAIAEARREMEGPRMHKVEPDRVRERRRSA